MPVVGSKGVSLDLLIRQGADLSFAVTLKSPDGSPVNLTGCLLRGCIRRKPHSPLIVATPVVAILAPAAEGKFTVSLPASVTVGLPAGDNETEEKSRYVWDLELVDSLGLVVPVFYGVARVFREVTK